MSLGIEFEEGMVPRGVGGIALRGGGVQVEMTSISSLGEAGARVCVVGVVVAAGELIEGSEEWRARVRVTLRSGPGRQEICSATLYGDLAWACRGCRTAATLLVSEARVEGEKEIASGGRGVAAFVEDEVLVRVEAAWLRRSNPEWTCEKAHRVAANKLGAFRKKAGLTTGTAARLAMRGERCWRCGDAYEIDRCASWPVCAGRRGKAGDSRAVAIELLPGLETFRVRPLPRPRCEPDATISEEEVHPICALESVATRLRRRAELGEIRGLREPPRAALEAAKKFIDDDPEPLLAKVPPKLRETLLPFQVEGVRFAFRKKRALLADEMGLGKTLQAIAFASALDAPLLVLCPAGLRAYWADQLETWIPDLDPSELCVVRGQNDMPAPPPASPPRALVISFRMLERLPELSQTFTWPTVVVDEAHVLATPASNFARQDPAVTRVACDLIRRATNALLVTGTPSLGRPIAMFSAIDALAAGCRTRKHWLQSLRARDRKHNFARAWAGARRQRAAHRGRVAYDALAFHGELHAILEKLFMARRLKSEVLAQLPPLTRCVARVEHSAAATSFQTSGLAKLDAAAKWIVERLVATRGKLVVFAHHVAVLDGLHAALEAARRDPPLARDDHHDDDDDDENRGGGTWFGRLERIDGSTAPGSRVRITRDFFRDASLRAVLVSVTAGGVGIDLSAASEAIFVESVGLGAAWLRQAEDRLHRRGQTNPVRVVYLLGPVGSWDNRLWPLLDADLRSASAVFNGENNAEAFAVDTVGALPVGGGGGGSSTPPPPPPPSSSRPEAGPTTDADETLGFQVSAHTGRVHLWAAGTRLRENFDLGALERVERLPPALRDDPRRLAAARRFAREWEALAPRQRDVLANATVAPPLVAAVSRLDVERARESRRRHLCSRELATRAEYHEAGELQVVAIEARERRGNLPPIVRTVCRADGSAKCLVCDAFYACSAESLAPDAPPLKNVASLFCGPRCRARYKATSSATGLRQLVFARDAGACANCGADGHRLVEELTALKAADWGRRYARGLELNEKWARYPEHFKKLIETPRDGLAWEADHVRRVADGGGEAAVEAVQTLCETKKKAKKALPLQQQQQQQQQTGGPLQDTVVNTNSSEKEFRVAVSSDDDEALFSDEEVWVK
ncbi:hypothetical protein CTAYLR_001746 [Chrysophaeum taylorii]|uniref:Uncharacterized protein n=1 Tax=Chrysophaeum taylorii TaxID=2483200 RepID=A0AAD7XMG6_9STRA|nr:hypothetical protein CTAYLR_001746 [Chrysophaeum taylorii]